MPVSQFLEQFPLYRKLPINRPYSVHSLPKPAIHMSCQHCEKITTFNMRDEYTANNMVIPSFYEGDILLSALYVCAACEKFCRYFYINLRFYVEEATDESGKSIKKSSTCIQKVGQFPAWEKAIKKKMKKMLGIYAEFYEKALTCESQGWGIGAYAYYRRVLEAIIDDLLEKIPDLIADSERPKYLAALEKVKKETIAENKIKLVADMLPPILTPNGINPLKILYKILSENLHDKSDEQCLEIATQIRESLAFLVSQILSHKETVNNFTKGMQDFLSKLSEPEKADIGIKLAEKAKGVTSKVS